MLVSVENITWRGLYERQPHVLHTYSGEMLHLFLMSAEIKTVVPSVLYTYSSKTRHLFSYKLFSDVAHSRYHSPK